MKGTAAALIGIAGAAVASAAPPLRVTSINQCTDQLVLALLPPGRIASVTWLARDPTFSLEAGAARRVAVNHGSAEDVLRDRPGLVVASAFGAAPAKALLRRAGVPVAEIGEPQTLEGIRQAVTGAARVLGEEGRGAAMLRRMDGSLAWLASSPRPAVRVAAWSGGGFGASPGSLQRLLLTLAGAEVVGEGGADVETLLSVRPALLVTSGAADSRGSLRGAIAAHPLVRRYWSGRTITLSPATYICGTPALVDAAVALRKRLLRLSPALRAAPRIGGARA